MLLEKELGQQNIIIYLLNSMLLMRQLLTIETTLRALDYDILTSTTAVFSYVIGSWKLSCNEQLFVGAQTLVIKFVTNNSNKTRCVIYSRQQSLHRHK